jgi:transcriptional regulator with XRE-family HTH domain
MNFLGKNIRYLRKQTSKTQSELASLIGKGQTTIGNWENGISEPNLDELLLLSNYFDTPLDILIKIDLAQTNWKVEPGGKPEDGKTGKGVDYDHAGARESMVEDRGMGKEGLQYVLQEIKAIREEIERINSRISSL